MPLNKIVHVKNNEAIFDGNSVMTTVSLLICDTDPSGHSECLETTGSPHGGACGQPKGCPTPLVRLWPL
jgi:hypothetical protein